jgi:succinate dehydrogenase/fumarate reductase flavoprotein subunit
VKVTVAGAGMAGLVAAARARELGLSAVVYEKGTRVGGSMLLSSCVVWRHVRFEDFRAECPGGDERLQRLVWERLDDALGWLVSRGAPVVWEDTPNPRTTGKRFEPRGVIAALGGDALLGTPLPARVDGPLVLATGGFPVRLARERGLLVRSNAWSEGDGIEYARARGAGLTAGLDEFYGRAMPGPVPESDYVVASQLYGRHARRVDDLGDEFFPGEPSWSENDLAQAIARRPGGRAWYELGREALELPEVAARVRYAQETEPLPGGGLRVRVHAAVTHTLGGLRVDGEARAADGIWAAGVDAGGVALGGYASGLAQALVLGLVAAESAAQACR